MYFVVTMYRLSKQHALRTQATYTTKALALQRAKDHRATFRDTRDISSQTHIKFLIFIFPRVFTFSGITQKKKTQSHFVNELHAFCPFFKAYHMGKHRRGLMHVSYCISSHNFTYIIHIFVYAILIPSVQFSLHLKSKWLKIYSKSLPERTKSVLLIFFSILVLHNCSYLVLFVLGARSPRIDGHMEP